MSLNKSKVLRTAEKYVLQGKIPAAIDEYRKVVDSDPADLTTINTLGDLFVRAGRIPDAIKNFARIADSYKDSGFTLKAIAMLKKISKLDPTNTDTAMKLANLYSQQGLFVEARQQYLQVADAYARAGQTRKALEAYQKIADLDPSNTSVRMKLAEIFTRERMTEQALESFIMAGVEFQRKGDIEQALNANLKALSVNPESRQALTAIATIYTQQNQADRAINILCDAFEKNPGDVELLTILGQTYLSAGQMDEAERTFLSLVELDRGRYDYLLEVGRRFLQLGDLDRASEQIDGCLDVLISKREEDKAIDFLRRIMDRDMNHLGSLKRLAQIFLRIREDHNLIATLNSLAEAAMRKGDDREAIAALRELTRLEPDETLHRQRLYNLGVRDISESDSPDMVRATGPLDYNSAAFDDAFVIRQISEAEILAGHGQIEHAVTILREILSHASENVQVHLKLKDIYLRAGMLDKASAECLELARVYEDRGEAGRANDALIEAHQLSPGSAPAPPSLSQAGGDNGFGFPSDLPASTGEGFEVRELTGGFDLSRYQTGHLSDDMSFVTMPRSSRLKREEPSEEYLQASQQAPDEFRYSDTLVNDDVSALPGSQPVSEFVFNTTGDVSQEALERVLNDELEGVDFYIAQGYVEIAKETLDRLYGEHGRHPEILGRYQRMGIAAPAEDIIAQEVPMPTSSAEDSLYQSDEYQIPEMRAEFSDSDIASSQFDVSEYTTGPLSNPEITSAEITMETEADTIEDEQYDESFDESIYFASEESEEIVSPGTVFLKDIVDSAKQEASFKQEPVFESSDSERLNGNRDARASGSFFAVQADEQITEEDAPFIITSESGPLRADTIAKLNSQELAEEPSSDFFTATTGGLNGGSKHETPPRRQPSGAEPFGTAELIESLVSNFEVRVPEVEEPLEEIEEIEQSGKLDAEAAFASVETEEAELSAPTVGTSSAFQFEAPAIDAIGETAGSPNGIDSELRSMLEDLRENTGELDPLIDYETHYSLGLAYKDMALADEAIEQFQMAYKMATLSESEADAIQCCNMLGVCFKQKSMHKIAVMWFQRGLNTPSRSEDEYQALRYEIGLCYEESGDLEKAIEMFMEVYGVDINYRHVGDKLKELQAAKTA
ncbi:MAG: hypothetical protein DMF61_10165 [Blastocatellia bacterium AA13]|nr:MAG: hypothetical protein DMF61_10165 [Blastocatellia bacterium AA13]